jgi:hypothetical protein
MNKNPNKENLKPFKKGESGNPNGRPKKIPELNVLLADVLGEEKDGIEAAKAILMALRQKATKGDVRAAEVLLNRAYGLPTQKSTTNGDLNLNVIYGRIPEQPASESGEDDTGAETV